MHMSNPDDNGINNFIPRDFTSVSFTTFDQAMDMVQSLGKDALLGKKDIKSAFRLLSVYPGEFDLLGVNMNGGYYIDNCLPFGCSISCSTFEKFSSFLEWLLKQKSGLQSIVHYLDDFLLGGSVDTSDCEVAMTVLIRFAVNWEYQ